MGVRIGINGAGRVGRSLVRLLAEMTEVELAAINDVAGPEAVAHLLRYDSVHGRFSHPVEVLASDRIAIRGRDVRFSAAQRPENIDWGAAKVDVVVEATGHFTDAAAARGHLDTCERVVVSAVSRGADATVVLGLHDGDLPPTARLVSNGSCTTHAAALPLALLSRWYGILAAEMTTVHCTTGSQVVSDKPHEDPRRARAAGVSMIPTSTTAALGIVEVLPELTGRLSCLAVRVPTPAVSLVEIVAHTERPLEAREVILQRFVDMAEGAWRGLLGVCDAPLVSADFIGDSRSSVIDSELLRCPGGHLVRLVAWYDNEWGYANRLADLLARWARA